MKETMEEWLAGLDINPGLDLQGLYDDLNTKGGGAMARVGAANIFNALAGLQSYSD